MVFEYSLTEHVFEARWKLIDNKLSNLGGVTLIVKLPLPKHCGFIRNGNGVHNMVLGVVNDKTDSGSEVSFNERRGVPNNVGQNWVIGPADFSGYFLIKDVYSGRYLTAVTADKLTIEGRYMNDQKYNIPSII